MTSTVPQSLGNIQIHSSSSGGGGSGDVVGPASSTDNAIARFDSTTGKLIQNSGITIADGATGTLSGTNTGDQTSIVGISGTKANFSSACTDGDFVFVNDTVTLMQMNTAKMLGRATAGTGSVEEISVTGSGNAVLATSPTLVTPLLGTPTSGDLTNCTGLPVSGITSSTSSALGLGSIELGNASDTTISRVSAGVIAVEGVTVPTISSTSTLTNKRITSRIGTETSSSTSTPTADSVDQWNVTALAESDTFGIPTGTPTDGQSLIIRIKDNGTARALAWNSIYRASSDLPLPSTTVINKTLYLGFKYNAADSKWDLLALLNNF